VTEDQKRIEYLEGGLVWMAVVCRSEFGARTPAKALLNLFHDWSAQLLDGTAQGRPDTLIEKANAAPLMNIPERSIKK
jgi:hypothetical protein